MTASITKKILAGLKPLFKQAKRNRLWFYHPETKRWFSPAELRTAQKAGALIFAAPHWELRDPVAFYQQQRAVVAEGGRQLAEFRSRLIANGYKQEEV